MKPHSCLRLSADILLLTGLMASGCRKAFLSQKPSSNLLIPNSLSVLQELLDNSQVMNISPAMGEVSADNYYLTTGTWLSLDTKDQNAYIWAKDIYDGQGMVPDWNLPYQQVFYANTVLQGLTGIQMDSTNRAEWKMLEGWALFNRAFAFFNIAELFAEPYDSATAATDPGIPIRLSPDVNLKTTRATLKASYDQILSDLHQADSLLPSAIPVSNLNRPSQPAVQALLARVYLSVRAYDSAAWYANSVLAGYHFLMDYNSLPDSVAIPIPNDMPEVLFQCNFPTKGNFLEGLVCSGCIVDSNLMTSYDSNDLRRSIFYLTTDSGTTFRLKGSYSGTLFPFSGLATDEMYLIRAECEARAGNTSGALNDMDSLLVNRWKTNTFKFFPAMAATQVLDTVLLERRKELAFRGIRWSDLRRLGQEGLNDTLRREVNGQNYWLVPRSNLYTLPIPPDVIQFSGIMQNPR